MNNNKF